MRDRFVFTPVCPTVQVGFEGGQYGKECAYGHPGSKDDAAIAKSGAAFVKATMGW